MTILKSPLFRKSLSILMTCPKNSVGSKSKVHISEVLRGLKNPSRTNSRFWTGSSTWESSKSKLNSLFDRKTNERQAQLWKVSSKGVFEDRDLQVEKWESCLLYFHWMEMFLSPQRSFCLAFPTKIIGVNYPRS